MILADALTKSDTAELTVDQVALAAGLGIDTVRYYQRLGLIPAPVRKGRRAAYCEEHVTRLAEIRRLADDGFTLAQIAALGDEPVATDPVADLRRQAAAARVRSGVGASACVRVRVGEEGRVRAWGGHVGRVRVWAGHVALVGARAGHVALFY